MHIRKRLTIVLITLAILAFIIGSIAGLLPDSTKTEDSQSYSNNFILAPLSDNGQKFTTTQPSSILGIELNSTDNLLMTVSRNGEIEYSKNESYLKSSFLLSQVGDWNVTFQNYHDDYVNYTLTYGLTTYTKESIYPLAWLIFPAFAAGQLTLCLLIAVTFYDDMKKWSKRTKEVILVSVLAVLALGFIPLLGLATGTNTPLISPVSASMEPTINSGDLAFVQGAKPRTLQVGDILVYNKLVTNLGEDPQQIESPTVHRINRIVTYDNKLYFVTKGDNNPNEDTWFVPEEGVVGKVVFVVPYVGGVFLFLSQLQVKIVIIATAFGIIALWPSKKGKGKIKLGLKKHGEKILSNS
jgi:signal peptidase